MENTDTSTPINGNSAKPRKKLNKWVKFLAIPLVALVILAFIAGIVLSAVLNPNQYKPQIETMFKEKAGYKLEIAGDIGISLMPLPKAYVENIKISNGSKQLMQVEQVNVYPQIFPLLRGEKKISSIVVKSPPNNIRKIFNRK